MINNTQNSISRNQQHHLKSSASFAATSASASQVNNSPQGGGLMTGAAASFAAGTVVVTPTTNQQGGVFHAPLPPLLLSKLPSASLTPRNASSYQGLTPLSMHGGVGSSVEPGEEAQQSFRIKRNALLHALQAKKNGNVKEFYDVINKQSFMNAKDESSKNLRIWVKVFLDTLTKIIHEYHEKEFLELVVFKLPWFIPTTTHGQSFNCFLRLAMAVLPHDVSYIHKVINHIFSSNGLFQCIILGEQRQVLSELLWTRAETLIPKDTTQQIRDELHKMIYEIKSLEEITDKAKKLMRRQGMKKVGEIEDPRDQMFIRTVLSFHPTRQMDEGQRVSVGMCQGHLTFFVTKTDQMQTDQDAISVKKCVVEISQEYTVALKDFAEKKYQHTPLKRIAQLLAKLCELYPAIAPNLVTHHLLEKLPHKNTAIDSQYLYYHFVFDFARHSPVSEERMLESIVDKLCQIDVDIKGARRHPQNQVFSSLTKIQGIVSQQRRELQVKVPSEREIKMGILFDMLLTYVKEKITAPMKDNDKPQEDGFVDLLLKILENKIFPIHKLNFMQYLPVYVIGLGSEVSTEEAKTKCKVFGEKLLSFLLFKAFKPTSNQQLEPLSVRMHAINFLASLIAKENNILRPQTIIKCLQYTLRFYENQKEQSKTERSLSDNLTLQTEASESDQNVQLSSDKLFLHCFMQALTHILVSKYQFLQREDPTVFTAICKLIFKKYFKSSLSYCSPLILADLLYITKSSTSSGLHVFQRKVLDLFKRQREDMQTSKRLVFDRITKYFPFDQPFYLQPAQSVIQNCLRGNVDLSKMIDEENDSQVPLQNIIIDSSSCIEIKTPRNNYMTGDDKSNYTRGCGNGGYESSYYQVGVRYGADGQMIIGNSEIDLTTSGPEENTFYKPLLQHNPLTVRDEIEVQNQVEDVKMEIVEVDKNDSNKSVLYEPNIDQMVEAIKVAQAQQDLELVNNSSSASSNDSTTKLKIDLAPAIAQSRQTDAMFNINNTLSAEAHQQENKEFSFMMSRNSSKLSSTILQEINSQPLQPKIFPVTVNYFDNTSEIEVIEEEPVKDDKQLTIQESAVTNNHHHTTDFFEIASSSKDTEISMNPLHKESIALHTKIMIQQHQEKMSDKQMMRRNVERRRRNITNSLKEENDRAITRSQTFTISNQINSTAQQDSSSSLRKSPRLNKTKM